MTQTRRSPGSKARATSTTATVATADSILYRAEDGYQAPTAAERREAELLAELEALGYTVAVSCTRCGHALTDPKSIARGHIGPKCRAKLAEVVAE